MTIAYPTLVHSTDRSDQEYKIKFMTSAQLSDFIDKTEIWDIHNTSKELAYLTHGIFRFYGKFPPPIARYLIEKYTKPGDLVLDPMVGSGTTAVDATQMKRKVICADVSPISELLVTVKCTPLEEADLAKAFKQIKADYHKASFKSKIADSDILLPEKMLKHWFLPETVINLQKLLTAVLRIKEESLRNVFIVGFISVIRKVSRATSQQGRLFLDVKSAEKDPWESFERRCERTIKSVCSLPKKFPSPEFIRSDIRHLKIGKRQPSLVICHPPYFNSYKYSSVFRLELAWMMADRKQVTEKEIREFFKVGKEENIHHYVSDLAAGIKNVAGQIPKGTTFAVMMGDTILHGNHMPTTKLFLDEIGDAELSLKSIAIRRPKYTEASWVTSQRRDSKNIGINISDFILVFKKR